MDTDNTIAYSADDIRKYFSGKMPASEMHRMEKAALDDPFLAEAMEGYAHMGDGAWKQLDDLKQQFAKPAGGKVIAMHQKPANKWWKYAAAVLLIGGGVALTYIFTRNETSHSANQNNIAQNNQQQIEFTGKKTDTPLINYLNADTGKQLIAAIDKDGKLKPGTNNFTITEGAKLHATTVMADSNFIYRPVTDDMAANKTSDIKESAPRSAETMPDSRATVVTGNVNTYNWNTGSVVQNTNASAPVTFAATDKDSRQRKEAEAVYQSRKEQQLNRNFVAQVLGPDNTPLPFANISIPGENFGTYADVKGNFRLISSDSILNVQVKSVGYEPQFYTIKSNNPYNRIVLGADNFKSKQDVAAKKIAAKPSVRRAMLLKDTVMNVEPADGWDNYETYVSNNIQVPDDVLEKNVHGEVEVSFEVEANGAITNIKVDKKLCGSCDEAAKKIIEQGPQWKVLAGKKGKARVKVKF